MTIYDISKKAGVSIATVSRVLNGSDKVRPATRKKVMDIIEKYDYTPNAFARGMGLHSVQTIGILCADSSDLFLAKAVYYLEQELQSNGYESLLCCTGYNLDIKKNYLNLILSKKVDGIILVGSNFIGTNEEENQYIKDVSAQVPIMLLNASFDISECVQHTSRRLPHLCSRQPFPCLTRGLRTSSICTIPIPTAVSKSWAVFAQPWRHTPSRNYEKRILFYEGDPQQMDDVANYLERLSKKKLSFHGVIASEDPLAIGAMKYARRQGLCVPEDLSVIGYNNSMLTTCCTPELTSVDNRLETQTHQLVQTLLGVLQGEEMPKKSIFSGKLIKRGTTLF